MRRIMVFAGIAMLLVAAASILFEEPEVVKLDTYGPQGRFVATELWIVDLEGRAFVRAGDPHAGWLTRLRSSPVGRLTRAGQMQAVRAVTVEDPAVREAVGLAMTEKYGLADRVRRWLVGDGSVAVRLDPLATASR